MSSLRYRVLQQHKSEFPDPILLTQGESVQVGETYDGPENWDGWVSCTNERGQLGWVPDCLLQLTAPHEAVVLEDYTARELDVQVGQIVFGSRHLNGWVWCETADALASGWVPLAHLELGSSPLD